MTEELVVPGQKSECLVPHRFGLRVYWEDTDAAGIVYYANYLRYIERARSDLVRLAGIDQSELLAADGLAFQVRRCEVDYLLPARLDDELQVETTIDALGAATIDMAQIVVRDRARLVEVQVRLACVGVDGRPKRIPAPLRGMLGAYVSTNKDA